MMTKLLAGIARLFQPITPEGSVCRHPGETDGYQCRCHRQMGNDFWLLPSNRCLWDF